MAGLSLPKQIAVLLSAHFQCREAILSLGRSSKSLLSPPCGAGSCPGRRSQRILFKNNRFLRSWASHKGIRGHLSSSCLMTGPQHPVGSPGTIGKGSLLPHTRACSQAPRLGPHGRRPLSLIAHLGYLTLLKTT